MAIPKRARQALCRSVTFDGTMQKKDLQELFVCLRESGSEFQNNEEDIVDDERPLAAPAIGCDTECDGADGSEHKNEGDTPGDIGDGFIECHGQLGGGQGDSEKIESVPCPTEEGDLDRLVRVIQ
jgi:hypothetical protein